MGEIGSNLTVVEAIRDRLASNSISYAECSLSNASSHAPDYPAQNHDAIAATIKTDLKDYTQSITRDAAALRKIGSTINKLDWALARQLRKAGF